MSSTYQRIPKRSLKWLIFYCFSTYLGPLWGLISGSFLNLWTWRSSLKSLETHAWYLMTFGDKSLLSFHVIWRQNPFIFHGVNCLALCAICAFLAFPRVIILPPDPPFWLPLTAYLLQIFVEFARLWPPASQWKRVKSQSIGVFSPRKLQGNVPHHWKFPILGTQSSQATNVVDESSLYRGRKITRSTARRRGQIPY